jgi:hypothetical protein
MKDERKTKKELIDELKSSGKTKELKEEVTKLERYRDPTVGWEPAIKELQKEIESLDKISHSGQTSVTAKLFRIGAT